MEGTKITYNPKEIIEYIERKGLLTITQNDLERDWEYEKISASVILSDLEKLGIIVPEEMDVGGRKVYIRNYHLTESGRKTKDSLGPRTIILTIFPVISQIALELINYLIEVLQAKGIDSSKLAEMLELSSPELKKLIEDSRFSVLKNLSPEELRQLAKEVKEARKDFR